MFPTSIIGNRIGPLSQGIDIKSDLVTYWPLNESGVPPIGNRADLHSNNYTLTEVGTVDDDTGLVYANAALFDMTQDWYLMRARAAAPLINFGAGDAFTLAAWTYPTAFNGGPDTPNYYRTIFSFNQGSFFQGGYWVITTTTGTIYCQLGKNGGPPGFSWHPALTCTLNTWNFVAFTYNDVTGQATATLNAATVTTNNVSGFAAATNRDFWIGIADATRHAFDGRIGPAMIWSRALSSADLSAVYNGGAGLTYAELMA